MAVQCSGHMVKTRQQATRMLAVYFVVRPRE